jgi:hypothetical protein
VLGACGSIATQGGSEATTVRAVEDVLTSPDVARFVTSYSWMARDFRAQTPDVTTSEVMNYGRIYDWGVTLRGVMPTFFDSVYSQFLKIGSQDRSSLPLPEAMYTTRGSQGSGVDHRFPACVCVCVSFLVCTHRVRAVSHHGH